MTDAKAQLAWYGGATLCQTVYTSAFYHSPDLALYGLAPRPWRMALRIYCLAYAKCIELAYEELSKGHAHDVEDCWLDTFGVPVRMEDLVSDIIRELDSAMDMCSEPTSEL